MVADKSSVERLNCYSILPDRPIWPNILMIFLKIEVNIGIERLDK